MIEFIGQIFTAITWMLFGSTGFPKPIPKPPERTLRDDLHDAIEERLRRAREEQSKIIHCIGVSGGSGIHALCMEKVDVSQTSGFDIPIQLQLDVVTCKKCRAELEIIASNKDNEVDSTPRPPRQILMENKTDENDASRSAFGDEAR